MRGNLSYQLLQTLRNGAARLDEEAYRRVCSFVEGQRTDGEAFMNRGEQADLYYTMFGWMLCYALGVHSDGEVRKAFLKQFDPACLDTLHQTVLTFCESLDRLLSLPQYTHSLVLRLMANDRSLLGFFDTYQRHGSGEGTNALAARLSVAQKPDAELQERLLSVQHESGGFLAHERAAIPDMLSTAVALFAMKRLGLSPRYDAKPFIEAHWHDDGSFTATLLDEHGDVEYEFYGLLALGSL